jgi:transmembrane sensor
MDMSITDIDRIWILTARKLMGDASNTELAELESLLEKHPAQQEILTRINDNWNNELVRDNEFMEATYLVHLGRMKEQGFNLHNPVSDANEEMPPVRKNRFRAPLLSLALLLILGLGWFVFAKKQPLAVSQQLAENKSEISTRNGNRTRIQLPDGSTVWLNAGSKLDYSKEFGNKNREVHLIGEGYFDVVRNPEKPFIIHTTAVEVKVLGTQFNVKSYPGDKTTETSLIKGSVEVFVKNRGEKWVLRPNEKLVVENELPRSVAAPVEKANGIVKREPLVAIKELTYIQPDAVIPVEASWTRNQLSFKDEPFAEVAKKMERWYDVEFEFRNKKPENLMMYGTFTNETLEQALEALQFSFGFGYEVKDKKVIIN